MLAISRLNRSFRGWAAVLLLVAPVHAARADLIVAGAGESGLLEFSALSSGWDGPGLGAASLTYYFGALTTDLPAATVKATLIEALGVWAAAADITFTETATPGLADSIDFLFATGDHGDGEPFTSGVLAHAALPETDPIGGDVHFNDAFTWEVGDSAGADGKYDLLYIAVHELGHSLGLGHSSVSGSVMLPSVGSDTAFTALAPDDIAGITAMYAPAAVPEPSSLALGAIALALATTRRRWRRLDTLGAERSTSATAHP